MSDAGGVREATHATMTVQPITWGSKSRGCQADRRERACQAGCGTQPTTPDWRGMHDRSNLSCSVGRGGGKRITAERERATMAMVPNQRTFRSHAERLQVHGRAQRPKSIRSTPRRSSHAGAPRGPGPLWMATLGRGRRNLRDTGGDRGGRRQRVGPAEVARWLRADLSHGAKSPGTLAEGRSGLETLFRRFWFWSM